MTSVAVVNFSWLIIYLSTRMCCCLDMALIYKLHWSNNRLLLYFQPLCNHCDFKIVDWCHQLSWSIDNKLTIPNDLHGCSAVINSGWGALPWHIQKTGLIVLWLPSIVHADGFVYVNLWVIFQVMFHLFILHELDSVYKLIHFILK